MSLLAFAYCSDEESDRTVSFRSLDLLLFLRSAVGALPIIGFLCRIVSSAQTHEMRPVLVWTAPGRGITVTDVGNLSNPSSHALRASAELELGPKQTHLENAIATAKKRACI